MSELFTATGRLLVRVLERPGITVKELAGDLFLTKRSIWGMVGKLRREGYLIIEKRGKTNHYVVSSFGLAELRRIVGEKA